MLSLCGVSPIAIGGDINILHLYGAKQINMRYDPVPAEFFQRNRRRFMRKMQPDSIALFFSNHQMPRSGDVYFPFKQNEDLWYLTGLEQPGTVLVLFPDCVKDGYQEVVFTPRSNLFLDRLQGGTTDLDQAAALSGIPKVFWSDEQDRVLHELILLAKRIYLNLPEHDGRPEIWQDANTKMARNLQARYPAHKYHRAQPILRKLRAIKSTEEIQLIREAIRITGKGFERILDRIQPGVWEHELEAELTYAYLQNRASGHAFPPTVASGSRGCILHYQANSGICQDGELLLVDTGAEYANYASDISRTIPVNGQFAPKQRKMYQAVLSVLEQITPLLVPGITLDEFHRAAGQFMEEQLLALGLLTPAEVAKQDKGHPAYRKYFMHRVAHPVGLQVHDMGNRYEPIQAGMVFAVEPGIYDQKNRTAIRLENILLVTDQGSENLSKDIPISIDVLEEKINKAAIQG